MSKQLFEEQATIFRALAHPVRLQILKLFYKKPLNVSELSQLLHKRQPNISQHLLVLKNANLILVQKAGKQRVYRFNKILTKS